MISHISDTLQFIMAECWNGPWVFNEQCSMKMVNARMGKYGQMLKWASENWEAGGGGRSSSWGVSGNQQLDPDKMQKEEGGEGKDGEKREGWGRKIWGRKFRNQCCVCWCDRVSDQPWIYSQSWRKLKVVKWCWNKLSKLIEDTHTGKLLGIMVRATFPLTPTLIPSLGPQRIWGGPI